MSESVPTGQIAEIYTKHRAEIIRYLHRMTRELPLAEELTQETFIKVDRGLHGLREETNLTTWIYRIATNVYLDHSRTRDAQARRAQEIVPCLPEAPVRSALQSSEPRLSDRLLEESEMGSCIREIIDSLPPDHRAVIVLHDLQGLGNKEIARILDCSLDAVKIRVHRARQKLRTLLDRECDFEHSDENVLQCDRKQPENPDRPS